MLSVDVWNQFVIDNIAVMLPVCAILFRALFLVPVHLEKQEEEQENDINKGLNGIVTNAH